MPKNLYSFWAATNFITSVKAVNYTEINDRIINITGSKAVGSLNINTNPLTSNVNNFLIWIF